MDLTTQRQREASGNPLWPYSWRALYLGGGELSQYDAEGRHGSPEIERARLACLQILGHPYSPIDIPCPLPEQVPDEVVLKSTVDTNVVIGLGNGHPLISESIRYFFGYRYGAELFLVEIDGEGQLFKTNMDAGQGSGADDPRWRGGGY